MGVLEGGAGLPAVVDDHQRVADHGVTAVLLDPVPDRGHDQRDLTVVEVGPRPVVVGRQHQHLVDAARRGLGEHRAEHGEVERGSTPRKAGYLLGTTRTRHSPSRA